MHYRLATLLTKFAQWIQFRSDTTRYFFDTPTFDYQPLPWINIKQASIRGEAAHGRWSVIKKHLTAADKSLKDIGGCVGFFCISAAEEKRMTSILVDNNPQFIRIAKYAIPEALAKHVRVFEVEIGPETSSIMPRTDVTLCLSIWHHWVAMHGLDAATRILQDLWAGTAHTLFFESGEEEAQEQFNLPFNSGEPARTWLMKYLHRVLPGSTVEIIGAFPAGSYAHYKIKNQQRSLFKITRTSQ